MGLKGLRVAGAGVLIGTGIVISLEWVHVYGEASDWLLVLWVGLVIVGAMLLPRK